MSAPLYPLEVLLEVERRSNAALAANEEERARTNLWRGSPRRIDALLAFERQWRRERCGYRRQGLRVSGHDATEQFVRCIRLWRVARVIGVGGWGSEDWTGVTAGSELVL